MIEYPECERGSIEIVCPKQATPQLRRRPTKPLEILRFFPFRDIDIDGRLQNV